MSAVLVLSLLAAAVDAPLVEAVPSAADEELQRLLVEETRLSDLPALDRPVTMMTAGFVVTAASIVSLIANTFFLPPPMGGRCIDFCVIDMGELSSAIISGMTAVFGGVTTLIGGVVLHHRSVVAEENAARIEVVRARIRSLREAGAEVTDPEGLDADRRALLREQRPSYAVPVAMFIDGFAATVMGAFTVGLFSRAPTVLTTGICQLVIGAVLNGLGIWQVHRQTTDAKYVEALGAE